MRRRDSYGFGAMAFLLSWWLSPQTLASDAECAPSAKEATEKAAAADRNGDGFLTKGELSLSPQDLPAVDANQDNRIETSEYQNWLMTSLPAICTETATPHSG